MDKTKYFILFLVAATLAACGDKEKDFDATGTFEATEVTVSAKASGELVEFHVTEGMQLAHSDIVGSIDNTQMTLKREQLEAQKAQLMDSKRQLASSKMSTNTHQLDLVTQLSVIRQQIANAQKEEQRYAELVRDGAAPKKQLDEIRYQISVLERQLDATEDQLRSNNKSLEEQGRAIEAQIDGVDDQIAGIDAQIAQLDDQITKAEVVCPIMGTVLEKYVEQGEFVTTGKPLFKMADMGTMTLRAYVTSAQLAEVKVGQKVTVTAEYGGGNQHEYEGTVTWISTQSEFTPKTIVTDDERADLVYAVKVAVKNDGGIKIGMYGKLKLTSGQVDK